MLSQCRTGSPQGCPTPRQGAEGWAPRMGLTQASSGEAAALTGGGGAGTGGGEGGTGGGGTGGDGGTGGGGTGGGPQGNSSECAFIS